MIRMWGRGFLALLALVLFSANSSWALDSVPGELLIKFKDDVPSAQRDAVFARNGAEVIRHFPTLGVDHIRLTSSRGATNDVAVFATDDAVLYAQPNYIRQIVGAEPPNDPRWLSGELWGLEVIQAHSAWLNFCSGTGAVVVVDIDTGANYNHPDLAANIWQNPGEIPGNGIDDDGNGYVDDIHGIDTDNHDSDPIDDDPFHSHGTHTAGTIAAVGNNGIGVVGVSWNAKVIPCKAFHWDGNGQDANIIQCFDYAIALKQRGVNIRATNNSYSGPRDPNQPFPAALKDAFDRAGSAGIVNVCAAGNDGANNDNAPRDPASFDSPSIIAVAASGGANDNVAGFTDYGVVSVDLAAPGDGILSTQFNDYGTLRGTSMSAPHVTGAVALLADLQTELSLETAKSLILNNVDQLSQWSGLVASGGRLNIFNSLRSAAFGKQAFSVSNVSRTGSNACQIKWPCAPGLRYRVYASSSLTSPFIEVGSILVSAPGQQELSFTYSPASGFGKFYLVRTVP